MKWMTKKSAKLRSRSRCRGSWTPCRLSIAISRLRLNVVLAYWFAVFPIFFYYSKAPLLDFAAVHAHWTWIATQSPRIIQHSAFTTMYVLFQLEPVRRPHNAIRGTKSILGCGATYRREESEQWGRARGFRIYMKEMGRCIRGRR